MAELQRTYPKNINIYNLRNFFDFKPVSTNQILPGMIVQFNYRSPEGVHDSKPLIYVLEVESDRIWGINLHYKLALLGEAVQIKKSEVSKANPQKEEPKQEQPADPNIDPKARPEQLNQKHIPSLGEIKKTLGVGKTEEVKKPNAKVSLPPQLLEKYTLTNQPKELLRNYLYSRASGSQKLVFKVL